MDENELTFQEIIDGYYSDKIKNECFTDDEKFNHLTADNILIDLIEAMELFEIVKAYKEVKKNYA